MMKVNITVLMLLIFGAQTVKGQFICKTSDIPNNAGNCMQELYDPVCGCDSVTYRHPCDATQIHNVQFYTQGICLNQQFTMDIYPIPATQANPVKLAVESRPNIPTSFSILIFDSYGVLKLSRNISNTTRYDWTIPAFNFKPGVYIALAYDGSTGFVVSKKFLIGSI